MIIENLFELPDSFDPKVITVEDIRNFERFFSSSFPVFGKRLEEFIRRIAQSRGEKTSDNFSPAAYIRAACKKENVDISLIASENTLRNWFRSENPLSPNKNEDSRGAMFALAFALKLNHRQTVELFNKVYLDRAFNYRDYKELIYSYCIANGFPFSRATELIDRAEKTALTSREDSNDKTIYTVDIWNEIKSGDTDILEFIATHGRNMAYINKSALANLETLKNSCFEYLEENNIKPNNNALYREITAQESHTQRGTTTVKFNKSNKISRLAEGSIVLPGEIIVNFPQPRYFNETTQLSYEKLRKLLVMVFSYWFWEIATDEDGVPGDIDEYIRELNTWLTQSNMPLLDTNNSYDCLFMYCTIQEDPLAALQDVLNLATM